MPTFASFFLSFFFFLTLSFFFSLFFIRPDITAMVDIKLRNYFFLFPPFLLSAKFELKLQFQCSHFSESNISSSIKAGLFTQTNRKTIIKPMLAKRLDGSIKAGLFTQTNQQTDHNKTAAC